MMSIESTLFAIGYQQPENGDSFPAMIAAYRDRVGEVYFPWAGAPSGRAALGRTADGGVDWRAQEVLESDLVELRRMGLALDLLFNANCYGADAMSERLAGEVISVVEHLGKVCGGPDVVTTTSLTIAHVIKTHFPRIKTRASVNMRIGTTQAMDTVAERFDSFCLQRDRQRDPAVVRKVHDWCTARGKTLVLLVNSGCLRFCPGQVYHDNAVAHDAEIRERQNIEGFHPLVCWSLYRDPAKLSAFLKSTWIRPEDLHHFEGAADLFKLATRQHSHPRMVLDAYTKERFDGNLMNLMEPCFAPALAPRYIDNQAFPPDWAERIAACPGDCDACHYCDEVLRMTGKVYGEAPRGTETKPGIGEPDTAANEREVE